MPEDLTARCPGTTSGEGALDVRQPPAVQRPPLPVVTETLAYEGADGVTVPAFLSRPVGDEPVPGVVHVHGGLAQPATPDPGRAIAAAGFAVLTPAYRGTQLDGLSVGDALRMSDIAHADARDVLRGAYWLLSQPFVNGAVALVGSSLGGGIANVLAFLYPDVWDAVVTLDAVTDWACVVTYLGLGSDQARVIATAFGGAPEDVPEEFRRVSPVYHPDRVAAPYYVVQGLADTLSPPGESQKWVDALRAAGVDVTWRLYEGQEHGFMRRLPFDSSPWQDLFAWLHGKLRGEPGFPLPS
jgi:dipeptidyl aminopeptidase/acylaminoacyl peptidase